MKYPYADVLTDCFHLAHGIPAISFTHCPREANGLAHFLATHCYDSKTSYVWVDEAPGFLLLLVILAATLTQID